MEKEEEIDKNTKRREEKEEGRKGEHEGDR